MTAVCMNTLPEIEAAGSPVMPAVGPPLVEDDAAFDLDIQAGRVERRYWMDLWRYRELFAFLAWRDLLVRYKQTVIGVLWALLQPFLTMLAFTVVFGTLARLPSAGTPYALLVFCGLLPWQFFARAISEGSASLVSNASLVSKVYFPHLLVPMAAVCTALADFLISCVFLGLLLVWFQWWPTWRVLVLPAFLLMGFALSLGAALWLAALNVKYRDFRYIVPFIIQFGLYVSPVGYVSSLVPAEWRLVCALNPMATIIDGFRWAILGGEHHLALSGCLVSAVVTAGVLAAGVRHFRASERRFADVI